MPVLEVAGQLRNDGRTSALDEASAMSSLLAQARRLRRIYKGFVEVAEKYQGQPKGLEPMGMDRLKQATEELRRMKAEFMLLNAEFDQAARKFTGPLKLGSPE